MSSVAARSLGRDVFVIHGRNKKARREFFDFLRAIGLRPIEWGEAQARVPDGSPNIWDTVDTLIGGQHAIVVLLTPDDIVRLDTAHADDEDDPELLATGQARPNVVFEAGVAFGRCPELTVLVEFGKVRRFTDLDGRFKVRLDNSPQKRVELANRLKAIGCPVDTVGKDWLVSGDLTPPVLSEQGAATS
ncbi:TIR domain-containing protein [Actinokineospora cianjurensis]|uniref:Putative nucleotide-binding protein with TIR-like domain n=1 Tax=Actinokineospora cianjurensis TaxID=585224 RepID=A0A421B9T4_9PSEU|nr:TIR domain-containing protein [Actinokineospora cianjurensis]RLK60903.1 putative nucleotide-binding protein with TIR-like domain [Actinokineospora cianjurensis]